MNDHATKFLTLLQPTGGYKILISLPCTSKLYKKFICLKGLSHEIDFKNFDQTLRNLAYLRDAAGV